MPLDEIDLASDPSSRRSESPASASASLETRFQSALDRLWIAFQPIVWRSRGRVHAYEALVRSRQDGLRRPQELLDTARRLGRARDLARAVRQRVAAVVRDMPP